MTALPNVQYGCGTCTPLDWISFNSSPTLRIQKFPLLGTLITRWRVQFPNNVLYGDIVTGLPVDSESAQRVYCSHVLEHLSLEDFRLALRETYRILATEGTFRGVMPDLERFARTYCESNDPSAAIEFMKGTMLGAESRPRGAKARLISSLGNSAHLSMWDYKALAKELTDAGFKSVRRATCGDNPHPAWRSVEDLSRWEGCLGFECLK